MVIPPLIVDAADAEILESTIKSDLTENSDAFIRTLLDVLVDLLIINSDDPALRVESVRTEEPETETFDPTDMLPATEYLNDNWAEEDVDKKLLSTEFLRTDKELVRIALREIDKVSEQRV